MLCPGEFRLFAGGGGGEGGSCLGLLASELHNLWVIQMPGDMLATDKD